jgi:hypothetical protein
MAIVALVLAIIPGFVTWIVAIILGIIVISRVKNEAAGKGLAIAALVISGLWIVLVTLGLVVGLTENAKFDSNRKAGSGEIKYTDLRKGDCLATLPTGDGVIATVDITPCSKPHSGEVFAVPLVVAAGDKPSQASVNRLALDACAKVYEAYIGVAPAQTTLSFHYIPPAVDSISHTNKAACIISVPGGGKTTGSLEGSGR